jgi:hypothetical protein
VDGSPLHRTSLCTIVIELVFSVIHIHIYTVLRCIPIVMEPKTERTMNVVGFSQDDGDADRRHSSADDGFENDDGSELDEQPHPRAAASSSSSPGKGKEGHLRVNLHSPLRAERAGDLREEFSRSSSPLSEQPHHRVSSSSSSSPPPPGKGKGKEGDLRVNLHSPLRADRAGDLREDLSRSSPLSEQPHRRAAASSSSSPGKGKEGHLRVNLHSPLRADRAGDLREEFSRSSSLLFSPVSPTMQTLVANVRSLRLLEKESRSHRSLQNAPGSPPPPPHPLSAGLAQGEGVPVFDNGLFLHSNDAWLSSPIGVAVPPDVYPPMKIGAEQRTTAQNSNRGADAVEEEQGNPLYPTAKSNGIPLYRCTPFSSSPSSSSSSAGIYRHASVRRLLEKRAEASELHLKVRRRVVSGNLTRRKSGLHVQELADLVSCRCRILPLLNIVLLQLGFVTLNPMSEKMAQHAKAMKADVKLGRRTKTYRVGGGYEFETGAPISVGEEEYYLFRHEPKFAKWCLGLRAMVHSELAESYCMASAWKQAFTHCDISKNMLGKAAAIENENARTGDDGGLPDDNDDDGREEHKEKCTLLAQLTEEFGLHLSGMRAAFERAIVKAGPLFNVEAFKSLPDQGFSGPVNLDILILLKADSGKAGNYVREVRESMSQMVHSLRSHAGGAKCVLRIGLAVCQSKSSIQIQDFSPDTRQIEQWLDGVLTHIMSSHTKMTLQQPSSLSEVSVTDALDLLTDTLADAAARVHWSEGSVKSVKCLIIVAPEEPNPQSMYSAAHYNSAAYPDSTSSGEGFMRAVNGLLEKGVDFHFLRLSPRNDSVIKAIRTQCEARNASLVVRNMVGQDMTMLGPFLFRCAFDSMTSAVRKEISDISFVNMPPIERTPVPSRSLVDEIRCDMSLTNTLSGLGMMDYFASTSNAKVSWADCMKQLRALSGGLTGKRGCFSLLQVKIRLIQVDAYGRRNRSSSPQSEGGELCPTTAVMHTLLSESMHVVRHMNGLLEPGFRGLGGSSHAAMFACEILRKASEIKVAEFRADKRAAEKICRDQVKAWLNSDAGRARVHERAKQLQASAANAERLKQGLDLNASNDHDDDLLTMHVLPWNVAVANAKESLLEINMSQLQERSMPDPAVLDTVVEMLHHERRIKEELLGHSHEEVGSVLVMISQVYELSDRVKDSIVALTSAIAVFDHTSTAAVVPLLLPNDERPETEDLHIAGSLVEGRDFSETTMASFKCKPCTEAVGLELAHLARMQRDELLIRPNPAIPNFTRAATHFTHEATRVGMSGMNEHGVNMYANRAAELWKEVADIYRTGHGQTLEMLVCLEKACQVLECGYGPCSVESTKMWREVALLCNEKNLFRESALAWKVAHEGFDVNFGPKDPQTMSALNAYKQAVSSKKKKFQHYDRDETQLDGSELMSSLGD